MNNKIEGFIPIKKDQIKDIESSIIKQNRTLNIEEFDQWLSECPIEFQIKKPSMNENDNNIIVEFNLIEREK
nr:hypothetical protein [uncultured Mediterranean phage uvMED]